MELLSETVTEVKKQIQEERSEREIKKDQIKLLVIKNQPDIVNN